MQWQRIVSIFTLLFSAAVFAGKYDYHLITQKSLPHQLGTFQELELNTADNQTVTLYTALLTNHYHAALHQHESKNQFFADYLDDLSHQHDFVLAINGGFYREDFTPAGLFLYQGKTINPASSSSFLNACLTINNQNKISLETKLQECKKAHNAMQAGPLLIQSGQKSDRLSIMQKKSKSMEIFFNPHRRTVLALTNDNRLLIIITSPIALLDLADFLQKQADAFGVKKIKTAINLDGGSSTGMYIRFADEPFYSHELKHVKTFIFIK